MKKFEVYKVIKQRQIPEHHVRVVQDKKKKADTIKVDWRTEIEHG